MTGARQTILAATVGLSACSGPASSDADAEFRILQLNLCHSGDVPSCFTGDDVIERANAVIGSARADVVTLNEVCRADIGRLTGSTYAGWFAPAQDPAGDPYPCDNGDDYGIGMLHQVAASSSVSAPYDAQDSGPEKRVWMCSRFEDGTAACATHLSKAVATSQCKELMDTNVPANTGDDATVVAGDFNLAEGILDCVPSGFLRADDGRVQHVMASSAHFDLIATDVIDMERTTDHPGLLVRLSRRSAGGQNE